MIQLWILDAETPPHDAQRTGADESVCGDCPQRPLNGGSCYVRTGDAPLSIWRKWRRGGYARMVNPAELAHRPLRLGAYGDPAALPQPVVERLLAGRRRGDWTGYTHQWREPRFTWLRSYVMASADSLADQAEAKALGWRSFRVHGEGFDPSRDSDHVLPRTIQCLALRGSSCADCGACNGLRGPDISIPVHGALAGRHGRLTHTAVGGLFQ